MAGKQANNNQQHRYRGLTLVELMAVLTMVAVMLAIIVPSYDFYKQKVNASLAGQDIREIEALVTRYEVLNNGLPNNLAQVQGAALTDPWSNPYQYLSIRGTTNQTSARKKNATELANGDYDLYSMGKDGITALPFSAIASKDDIVRANNGKYLGLVKEY